MDAVAIPGKWTVVVSPRPLVPLSDDIAFWAEADPTVNLSPHGNGMVQVLVQPAGAPLPVPTSEAGAPTPGRLDEPGADHGMVVLRTVAMDLPPLPATPADPGGPVLFHVSELPDPDLLDEWLAIATRISADVGIVRRSWLEVVDIEAGREIGEWAELHISQFCDDDAMERLRTHPLWVDKRPLHDAIVGRQIELVVRPIVDHLERLVVE